MRAHLEQIAKSGKVPPLLLQPNREIPPSGRYLWEIFWEIASGRAGNGFSLNPISFVEIETWARLNHSPLEPWEVRAIKEMDVTFLKTFNELKKNDANRN